MPNDEVSILNVNDDIRDVEDEWLRQEISETGLMGHAIVDYEGTEYPFRSKMLIKNSIILDDPVNNKTMINIKENIFIDKPQVIVGTYTYDGTEQGPEISGLTDDMIVQNDTNINAGTYTLIIKLKDEVNSYWSDYTQNSLMFEYTINKIPVMIPEVTGSYRYNMEEQTPEILNLNEDLVEVSGVLKATNAGSYTMLFDLKDKVNYIWNDESSTIKNSTWTIEKGFTYISDSYTNPRTFNATNLYTDMTIKISDFSSPGAEINRQIHVTSNDTNVATVEKIGEFTYRITGNTNLEAGRTAIHVLVDETDNYRKAQMDEYVIVDMVPELNECSWQKISDISAMGVASTCWSIGDRKEITLNGNIGNYLTLSNYKTCVFILGFNTYYYENGSIDFGCFKSSLTDGYDIALVDSKYLEEGSNGEKCFSINHWVDSNNKSYSYGGWSACDMRYDILGSTNVAPSNYGSVKTSGATGYDATSTCATSPVSNTLMSALPSDLRSVMKPITKWSDNGDNHSGDPNATSTIDYLPLMYGKEYLTFTNNSKIGRHNHTFSYYQSGNSFRRKSHVDFSSISFWERSPAYGSVLWDFCTDGSNPSQHGGYSSLSTSRGIAPVFLV